MKIIKLMLLLAVPIVIFQFWYTHQPKTGSEVTVSPNGFIPLPTIANADPRQVVVFAPENCPQEEARRSDDMARQLITRRIPSVRSHDVTFTSADPDPGTQKRLDAVMNGEFPIVFVNGKGKANPTLDEVVAEYESTR
ncbi:MAG TPA: hypothetical protein VGQ60_03080 [Nitrospiraceae bacterium]|jgi:hypothetical protein|nr:hypothetical protein [Nitrospiraceae bacterium]